MKEKRKLQRRHLIFYLRIFDDRNDVLLGYLADITTQGIKIMSEEPLKVGQLYKLKMWINTSDVLHFDAYSRWSQQNLTTDFYDTGFELKNLSTKNFKVIKKIIEELGLIEQDA